MSGHSKCKWKGVRISDERASFRREKARIVFIPIYTNLANFGHQMDTFWTPKTGG